MEILRKKERKSFYTHSYRHWW